MKEAAQLQYAVDLEHVPAVSPFPADPVVTRIRAAKWGMRTNFVLLLFVCASVASLLSYVLAYRNDLMNQKISVSFDIKAIDEGGHPVSGAKVFIDQSHVGVTDSFGEWRNYVAVKPQSALLLKIERKSIGELLTVTKNYAIPRQAPQSEVIIKNTIRLSTLVDAAPAKAAIPTTPAPRVQAKGSFTPHVESLLRSVTEIFSNDAKLLESFESIQFFPVTAHLFEVKAVQQTKEIWLLRNVVNDSQAIAAALRSALLESSHPATWTDHRLRLTVPILNGDRIYAGGRLVQNGVFRASKSGEINIAIVRHGQLAHRQRLAMKSIAKAL